MNGSMPAKPPGEPRTGGPRVCALAYDGLCTFEFGIVVEVFALPRPELDVDWYSFSIAALDPGPLTATGGFTLATDGGLEQLDDADLIIIPGWRGIDEAVPSRLIGALRRAHERGARLASICSGVFVLAATGLLEGRRATTHWRYAHALQARFGAIDVIPDVLYVEEGQIITSAGSAAGLDMCLQILRNDYGPDITNQVARRLVMPAHREGGQAQFIPKPVNDSQTASIGPLLDRIRASLHEDWDIARMSREGAISTRTLLRRFREATGLSPNAWLVAERVALARDLLETGDLDIATIAWRCGFGAPETLRHHFRRLTGTSPSRYRMAFQKTHHDIVDPPASSFSNLTDMQVQKHLRD